MALFQKTVINKYLQTQKSENLISKWDLFRAHFHNPIIQENIRNSKEEQYQEGFLRDLFVSIFGYQLNPAHNFNLTTEYKNVKDSKKADGAIIINDEVVAIIELKGMTTTDLAKIEDQAFGYKNNQENCTYVITSNFEKLRFYVHNAIEHIEFNLFELTQEQFNLMYLILAFENIKNNIPKKLKDESLNQEDIVTKKLYKDYSIFKRELFQNLILLNPEYDPLLLFQKSQKLLDRLLFLFFGEDRGLLPPNSVRQILAQWNKLQDLDEYVPLYNRYKKYFGYLNTGFKGKNHDVFAYNGGLFKADEVLDNITIDDQLLYDHTYRLSQYDFASEVDVNILGHIFENSLNEIDEIKAQLEGQEIDKSKSKRKKDGVFYTPKYITKYIVENTVGKLCEEKKGELGIIEEEYFTDKKRHQRTSKNLLDKLDHYRDWLLQLTIVDPACGSGAFLNEALNFLIKEHQYIDELEAKLRNVPIIFSYHSESILEHNLFGVDLNEESVEIAKLSLWLRTAEPNRKLNSLNDNIKCGNSLIDDPEVAGEKAFKWEEEFPQVFAKGGFDVVIGNPPYVRNELISIIQKKSLEQNFKTFSGKSDLYVYFFEQACNLAKKKGKVGFIVSSKYTKTKYGKILIDFLQNNTHILSFIDFKDLNVFEGIVAYPSIILLDNNNEKDVLSSKILVVTNENYSEIDNQFKNSTEVLQKDLFDKLGSWTYGNSNDGLFNLIKKINSNHPTLQNLNLKPQVGIKTGLNNVYIFNIREIPEILTNNNLLKKYVVGREVKRYGIIEGNNMILFPYEFNEKQKNLQLIKNLESFKEPHLYLTKFREKLSNRAIIDKGIINGSKLWYEFQQIKLDFNYDEEYIIYPDISSDVNFTLVRDSLMDMTCFGIPTNSRALLGILNSKLIKTILDIVCVKARGGYLRLKNQYLLNLPIPIYFEKEELSKLVEIILNLNKDLQEISAKFQRTCERKFDNLNLHKKLQDWYNLSYADFIKELSKQKIKLTLLEEAEWADYFDQEKGKALGIQTQITATDQEIDQMVYELYGLSEEEIKIVEGN